MAKEKKLVKKGTKLINLSSLSKAEIAKINLDNLWIMKPDLKTARRPRPRPRPRYCGCRSVCLV